MITLRIKPLALALASSLLISQVVQAGVPEAPKPGLFQEVSTTPGRAITPADEALLSSSAGKVLRHIGMARDAIRKKEGEQAKQALRQARTLLDIIQANLPSTVVKERIWTADNKHQYENSEEVTPDRVPITASLEAQVDFGLVKLPSSKPRAKVTGTEPEAEDAALYYEETDLPVQATREFIESAQAALDKNRMEEADRLLRTAQNHVDSIAIFVPEPLLSARVNLERAHVHFKAGQVAEAKADVGRAIEQLKVAGKRGDPEVKADVQRLQQDAESLQGRLDHDGPTLGMEMNSLWRYSKALADRAMEYSSFGWNRLRNNSPLRGDLIEAKRYVAYADIDANVAGNPDKAHQDLEQARTWLDKAAAKAKGQAGAEVQVKDARAMVDTLISGQAKMDTAELGNLKSQLGQAIGQL